MFGWIKKLSKGDIEITVERLESFVAEHGPLRRAAVVIWVIWTTNKMQDLSFRRAFFEGNSNFAEANHVLTALQRSRDQNAHMANVMKKVHAELGLGASELGHYTAIRYTALDLTCATIGACMRADLIDRVSMLWSSFLDSLPQGDEAKLAALVEWLRSEAQDVVESGLRDPLTDIDPEQFKNTAAVPRLAQR